MGAGVSGCSTDAGGTAATGGADEGCSSDSSSTSEAALSSLATLLAESNVTSGPPGPVAVCQPSVASSPNITPDIATESATLPKRPDRVKMWADLCMGLMFTDGAAELP